MNTHTARKEDRLPWYKHPAPWLLMLGPFIVVVAALYSAWLAITSADGLGVEDYYKQGLNVDRTIALSERARALGLRAGVAFSPQGIAVRLSSGTAEFSFPKALTVTLSHPTRAGLDQAGTIFRAGDVYRGEFRLPRSGHWLVQIEDDGKTWRLMGNVVLPAQGEATIGVVTEK